MAPIPAASATWLGGSEGWSAPARHLGHSALHAAEDCPAESERPGYVIRCFEGMERVVSAKGNREVQLRHTSTAARICGFVLSICSIMPGVDIICCMACCIAGFCMACMMALVSGAEAAAPPPPRPPSPPRPNCDISGRPPVPPAAGPAQKKSTVRAIVCKVLRLQASGCRHCEQQHHW